MNSTLAALPGVHDDALTWWSVIKIQVLISIYKLNLLTVNVLNEDGQLTKMNYEVCIVDALAAESDD